MLVLSRKPLQQIIIGPGIVITILKIDRSQVRVGIQAPPDVAIVRQELANTSPPTTKRPPLRGRKLVCG